MNKVRSSVHRKRVGFLVVVGTAVACVAPRTLTSGSADAGAAGRGAKPDVIADVFSEGGSLDLDRDGVPDVIVIKKGNQRQTITLRDGRVVSIETSVDEELVGNVQDRGGNGHFDKVFHSERSESQSNAWMTEDDDGDGFPDRVELWKTDRKADREKQTLYIRRAGTKPLDQFDMVSTGEGSTVQP